MSTARDPEAEKMAADALREVRYEGLEQTLNVNGTPIMVTEDSSMAEIAAKIIEAKDS